MSTCNVFSLKRKNIQPWIKHFEQQASGGSSPRSDINRHYILVADQPCNKQSFSVTSPGNPVPLPPLVTPVEQSFAQASEEVKREHSTPEKDIILKDFKASTSSPAVGIKRSRKRKSQYIARDVFS